jgi:hypothetical protein
MKIVDHIKRESWEDFLERRPDAKLVHTPQWTDFLEKSFDFHSKHLFTLNENDEVTGMLPIFKVGLMLRGSRLCSSPFYGECGFIGDAKSFGPIIERAMDCLDGSTYLEIRSAIDDSNFEVKNLFSTYILDLSTETDKVWEKLNKGSVRRAIKKSNDKGVSVVETKNTEDLRSFYELNCINKKEKGVPCHPWRFFKNMFDLLGDYSKLYLSMYENRPVAGGIINFYKENTNYGYGASDPDYLSLYPNNAFLWKSIEDACLAGSKYYDFGRVSYDNVGLIDFKKRWGTRERKLYYSFYPHSGRSFTEDRSDLKFKLATNILKRAPKIVYENFSDNFFGYFG